MRLVRLLAPLLTLIAAASPLYCFSQTLHFTPFHRNGIYRTGEIVGWRVTCSPTAAVDGSVAAAAIKTHSGPHGCVGHYAYTVKRNNLAEVTEGRFTISSKPGPGRVVEIRTSIGTPAMLRVRVRRLPAATRSKAPSTPGPIVARLGAAVTPTQLTPVVPRPADFDDFWTAQLARLKRVPIHPVLVPKPSAAPGVKLFTVTLDSVGSHVHGYLAYPAHAQAPGRTPSASDRGPDSGERYPALILYQWAGVYKLDPSWATVWASQGWLTFDVDSHDLSPTLGTGIPADYQNIGDTNRNQDYFLKMYLRDTRALDFIRDNPHWDGKTVVFMGTSMGGQQSLVTAGLNPGRVTAVLVDEPAGCDVDADLHGRQKGYPFLRTGDPRVARTALYFDPINFAPHITAPTLVGMGFIDTIAPPAGIWTAYNLIPGPKEAVPLIESNHNNITPDKVAAFTRRAAQVLSELRAGRPFRPNPSTAYPH